MSAEPPRKLQIHPTPDKAGLQLTYELSGSRRVHPLPRPERQSEPPPHAAGSYHNPKQHQVWMDRLEALQRKGGPSG